VKTISLKKVSAIAVASLGFGLLSVVPAQAGVVSPVDKVTSINLASATASPKAGSIVEVNFGATTLAAVSVDDTAPFVGVLSSYPSGGFVGVTARALAAGSVTASTTISASNSASGATLTQVGLKAATLTATSTVGAGSFNFTPTVAGDYVLTVWHDPAGSGVIDTLEARQTIAITVAAVTGFSAQLSTSFVGVDSLSAGSTQALTADDEVRVSSAVTTAAAMIGVTLKNTSGTAFAGGGTLDVQVISGPGLVNIVAANAAYGAASVRADTEVLAAGTSTANIAVTADGTGGTSQIRIRLLNSTTGVSLGTIATETVYFYGTVATLVATPTYTVARANATERGCANATTCIQDTFANTPFVVIKATDADGNLVPGLTVTSVSANGAIIASSTVVASTTKSNTSAGAAAIAAGNQDPNGLGYYNASVAGAVGAASAATTTVTYRTLLSGTTYVTSAAVTFTIGGAVAKETLSLDKTSYAPAEAMIVTRTATDSAGNAPYDGQTANLVSFNKPQGGTAPQASWYVSGKKVSAKTVAASSLFAPVSGGAFIASMISSVDGVTAINASSSVTDANAALLTQIDALNAKIVALNALIAKIMKKLGVK